MAGWYRTGTVSVVQGSVSVTGSGTAWSTQINVGDVFTVDNVTLYEIVAIASDTSLTLDRAYLGATNAAAPYAIIRNFTASTSAGMAATLAATNQVYQQAVTGALSGKFGDGSVAAPGVAFLNEPNSGFVRLGAGSVGLSLQGNLAATLSASSWTVPPLVTTNIQTGSVNGAQIGGMRRVNYNGDFSVAQRGTSFSNSPSGAYTLDGWANVYDGTGAFCLITQYDDAAFGGPSRYAMQYAVGPAAGSGGTYRYLATPIEGRVFWGQSFTISFRARSILGSAVQCSVRPANGGYGNAAKFQFFYQNFTISPNEQIFSFTYQHPGGTDIPINNEVLYLFIYFPNNQSFNILLKDVQVEAGSIATPFERRSKQVELQQCQRYYYRTETTPTSGLRLAAGSVTAAGSASVTLKPPIPMRTTPSITIPTLQGFMLFTGTGSFTPNFIGYNPTQSSPERVNLTVNVSGSMPMPAPAELIIISGSPYIEMISEI